MMSLNSHFLLSGRHYRTLSFLCLLKKVCSIVRGTKISHNHNQLVYQTLFKSCFRSKQQSPSPTVPDCPPHFLGLRAKVGMPTPVLRKNKGY